MFHPTASKNDMYHRSVVIRRAGVADEAALARLAGLDSARPLAGDALIALVGDEAWAAISLEDGRVIADPFRRSASAVALLRMRAGQLRQTARGRSSSVYEIAWRRIAPSWRSS